jgi:hypothetical protein
MLRWPFSPPPRLKPVAEAWTRSAVGLGCVAGDPISSEVAAIFRANEHSPTVKKLIDQIVRSPEVHLPSVGGNAAQSKV